jgi:hypothetical protein
MAIIITDITEAMVEAMDMDMVMAGKQNSDAL